jgi:hypothetical protein
MGSRLGVDQRRYLRGLHRASSFYSIAFWMAVRGLLLEAGLGVISVLCDDFR